MFLKNVVLERSGLFCLMTVFGNKVSERGNKMAETRGRKESLWLYPSFYLLLATSVALTPPKSTTHTALPRATTQTETLATKKPLGLDEVCIATLHSKTLLCPISARNYSRRENSGPSCK
eukprot:gb/GECG01011415.1/.p1 GENE.gb/GECG01011415.1/~~gb/GECG01011415.1/.p1  ORF type:complete len:120 (+),score=11.68 gb/GECG01011415.1/:1-360(+)